MLVWWSLYFSSNTLQILAMSVERRKGRDGHTSILPPMNWPVLKTRLRGLVSSHEARILCQGEESNMRICLLNGKGRGRGVEPVPVYSSTLQLCETASERGLLIKTPLYPSLVPCEIVCISELCSLLPVVVTSESNPEEPTAAKCPSAGIWSWTSLMTSPRTNCSFGKPYPDSFLFRSPAISLDPWCLFHVVWVLRLIMVIGNQPLEPRPWPWPWTCRRWGVNW